VSIKHSLIRRRKVELRIDTKSKRVILFSSIAILVISAIIIPFIVLVGKKDKAIRIESDEDFLKYNFPGSGTAVDPFIIENYEIETEEYSAIAISNVTKSFIVRNNQLRGSNYGMWIAVSTPDLAIITNNTFNLDINIIGIQIYDTSGCQIINNTFRNTVCGIAGWKLGSEDSRMEYNIINNTFINISDSAVILVRINKAVIEGNVLISNEEYKEQNGWKRGFSFYSSGNITLKNNNLSNMGVTIVNYELEAYLSHIVEDNLINGKELGYFMNLKNETYNPTDFGELYFINCSFIQLENSFLDNSSIGLSFAFCSNCSSVGNSFSQNGYAGMLIMNSIGIDIHSNIFDGNYYGLDIIRSLDIDIDNNTFKNGSYGCYIDNSTYTLGINTFQNNELDLYIRD